MNKQEQKNIISEYLSENKNSEIDNKVNSEAKAIQKQHLIDLMNMKTIEEVSFEMGELFFLDFKKTALEPFEFDFKSGFNEGFINGANYQKQIDENLAVEFIEFYNKYTCGNCGGYGYTVEVEAECCMRDGNSCCGIPNPVHVQRQCPCIDGKGDVNYLFQIFQSERTKKA